MPTDGDELFPSSPRTLYKSNPLVQVVCQLRFPPILRIDQGLPVDFQDRIRGKFPYFERVANPFGVGMPPEVLRMLSQTQSPAGYQFMTEDEVWRLELNQSAISLTTSRYESWEEFFGMFGEPLAALVELYQPSFFSRVGLRYINAIERQKLGLGEVSWSLLLRSELLGELALPQFEMNAVLVNRTVQLSSDGGIVSVILKHGYGKIEDRAEQAYLIDLDFFTDQRTEVDDAKGLLDRFNRRIGCAFRWAIRDELHNALGPRPLGGGKQAAS